MQRRVNSAVTRSNLLLLLLCVVILLPSLFVAATTSVPYFTGKFGGARVFRAKELIGLSTSSLPVYFADVTGSDMSDTGYYKDNTHLGALELGDRYLLVELSGEVVETQTGFTGTLYPLTSELRDQVISDIESDYPRLRGVFLPYYLSVSDAGNISWYFGALALIAAILGSLYGLLRAVSRLLQPSRHPIWKRLGRYGMNPEDLLASIDMDVERGANSVARVQVSRNWIVYGQGTNFNVMRVDDVAWLYLQVQTNRVNFIPVSKTYRAMVLDQYGVSITIQNKEAKVKEVLTAVAAQAPWAVFGYTAEIARLWKQNRAGFTQQVAERKKQLQQE